MKKKFLIPTVLLTAMAYSCVNNQRDNDTLTSVSGLYSIGGAEINGEKKLLTHCKQLVC